MLLLLLFELLDFDFLCFADPVFFNWSKMDNVLNELSLSRRAGSIPADNSAFALCRNGDIDCDENA